MVTDLCPLIVDDFREKTGIERVVEALQCAEWPNMKMKGMHWESSSCVVHINPYFLTYFSAKWWT